jgi:AMP-binding enzyme C-terminal domain/3-hydroxyacyl-CoA dehydrogenase, NAD binding domain
MSYNKPIRRIAIAGTGVIGASWAAEYLARGFDVVATDSAPNAEANLRKYIDNAWKDLTTIGLSKASPRPLNFHHGSERGIVERGLRARKRARASRLQDQAIRRYERCDSGGFTHRLEFFRNNTKVIHGHPAVREVAAFGIPDPKWGEIGKACVVLKPGKTLSPDELIAFCRQSLANHKIPRRIEFSETELPKSGSGKILKRVLRDPAWARQGRAVA